MATENTGAAEPNTESKVEFEDKTNQMAMSQEGVEEGSGGNAEEQIAAEDENRQAIYEKHSERRREQLGIEAGAGEDGNGEGKGEQQADEEITVKVNGRERKVPKSKVDSAGGVDAYQKNAAASELLNHASAEARRLRDIEQNLILREQQLKLKEHGSQAGTDGGASNNAPPDEGALRALAKKYHEAIVDGDMETADELLVKMQAAPRATAVDQDAIAKKAVQKAREELAEEENRKTIERMESERLEAVAEFESKHSDLANDPELRKLVNAKTAEIYREDPNKGPKAIIADAIKQVREMVKRIKTPTSKDERLDAKRSQTTVRGGSARAAVRPAQPPQTRSQYVQELRKSRGLE